MWWFRRELIFCGAVISPVRGLMMMWKIARFLVASLLASNIITSIIADVEMGRHVAIIFDANISSAEVWCRCFLDISLMPWWNIDVAFIDGDVPCVASMV